mgnify:CR=1 FL=1
MLWAKMDTHNHFCELKNIKIKKMIVSAAAEKIKYNDYNLQFCCFTLQDTHLADYK